MDNEKLRQKLLDELEKRKKSNQTGSNAGDSNKSWRFASNHKGVRNKNRK